MRMRRIAYVAVLVAAVALNAGCVGKRKSMDGEGGSVPAVASLRSPMATAAQALHELQAGSRSGNDKVVRESYEAFAAAFGEVLAPISHTDGKAAQTMANANTALQEALGGQTIDRQRVAREAEVILTTLGQVAQVSGFTLTGNASVKTGAPGAPAAGARVIEVRAREYRFEPPTIEAKAGEQITIRFANAGTEKHEFELEELDKEIEPIAPGTTAEMTFSVEKAGTYEYACRVDGHYEKGMKGQLIVR